MQTDSLPTYIKWPGEVKEIFWDQSLDNKDETLPFLKNGRKLIYNYIRHGYSVHRTIASSAAQFHF